jgi:hypothetical protein
MQWGRKMIAGGCAIILLICLLGGAVSASLYLAFHAPDHLEQWTTKSNLAQSFSATIAQQAETLANGNANAGDSALSGPIIQRAVRSAFPTSQLQQDIATVIASNYDWLQAKTVAPDFSIDLTSNKATFANAIAAYIKTRVNSLPICSTSTLLQLTTFDPLASSCRPQNLSANTIANEVSQQLVSSTAYLATPVLTAASFTPKGSTPYYRSFARAPQIYGDTTYVLIVFAAATIALVGLLLVALPGWRRGTRRVAGTFTIAAILLAAGSLLSDKIVSALQHNVLQSSGASIETAGRSVFQQAVNYVMRLDLYIAAGLFSSAILLYLVLIVRHNRVPRTETANPSEAYIEKELVPEPIVQKEPLHVQPLPIEAEPDLKTTPTSTIVAPIKETVIPTKVAAPQLVQEQLIVAKPTPKRLQVQPGTQPVHAMDIIGSKPRVWTKPDAQKVNVTQIASPTGKQQVRPRHLIQ